MTYDNLVKLIGSVGFPIAMCIVLVYIVYKMNETHKQEIEKVTNALNNNTQALIRLSDKLGVDIDVKQ